MKSKPYGTRLIEASKKLQGDADGLLASSGLPTLLRRYGQVELVGSYPLGLMTHGDIDMHISRNGGFTKWEVLKILARIVVQTPFTRSGYYHCDQRNSKKNPNLPYGYYIGLKTTYCGQKWTIDLWFVGTELQHGLKRIDMRNVELTDAQRVTIMRLKRYLGKIGVMLWGQRVYEAVVLDGVTTIAGFKEWLKKGVKK